VVEHPETTRRNVSAAASSAQEKRLPGRRGWFRQ